MKSEKEILSLECIKVFNDLPENIFSELRLKAILSAMQTYANQSKWISVEERLPENTNTVNVHFKEVVLKTNSTFVDAAYYDQKRKCFMSLRGYIIVAESIEWQPLPEPPNK